MLEDDHSYSDNAESDDLPTVRRRPHRSHTRKPETSAGMDRNHYRRKRHGDEEVSPKDDHTNHEPGSHRHGRKHRRKSSTAEAKDTVIDKPRDKEHGGKVRRRSSVSSTARPRRESTSKRIKTAGSQQSELSHREPLNRVTKSTSSSKSLTGRSSKGTSKARGENNASRPRRSSSRREKSGRPGLAKSSTSTRHTAKLSSLPTVKEEPKPQPQRPIQRSLSVFGNLFGPLRPNAPEEKVSCLTCMDDFAPSKAPMLTCGHRMCYSCLKRIFTLSVTDPAHMPPKCCADECIPLKHVQKLFDDRFKIRWNRKYHEYTTKNRIYCPAKGCGSWIPPKDITRDKDGGRKYGTCHKCKTQVCAACNGKRHRSKECPQDDSVRQFADMAKDNGWQKCYNCSATVELKEGCNHMTCRCTAQFCMICGSKWKTCNCPWFNYGAGNGGFLDHMNVYQVREEIVRGGEAFAQPRAYAEELERRREQERQDEELARRLQGIDLEFGLPRGGFEGVGLADIAGHFLNPDVMQRATNILSAGLDAVQRPPAENTTDNTRNQPHVFGAAAAFAMPAPGSSALRTPLIDTRFGRPPPERRPLDIQQQQLPPPPPGPTLRRSAQNNQLLEDTDSSDEETEKKKTNKGPAVLAGLNRVSDTSRVNAWRRHITGEPPISPL